MTLSPQNVHRTVALLDQDFHDLQAVYLFGSGARDEIRGRSDIDLAVMLPPGNAWAVSYEVWTEARLRLESELRSDVDLVNLRTASTVLCKEVIRNGRLLCCRDRRAVADFEMLTLSLYQKLNAERAGIVAAILSSGRVLA